MIARRTALGAGLALGTATAQAQTAPRPLTWIVPFGAGGIVDVLGRVIAQRFSIALQRPVVIENRPGAGGTVGAEYAARAAPDGNTILTASQGSFAAAPMLYANLRFDPRRDFVPFHGQGAAPNYIVTRADAPWNTLAELAQHARARPEALSFGSTGIATGQHLSCEVWMAEAGVRMTHVPYQAQPQALNDLMGGRLDVSFDYFLTSGPHVRNGRLKALGVTAPRRLTVAPDVPTVREAGFPNSEFLAWTGCFVPARTPPEVVARLEEAMGIALRDLAVVEAFDRTATLMWSDMNGAALGRWLEEDTQRMRALLTRIGIRPS
jgi:tripartite-type tricarboxylate transporter receptor subunit TctC